MARMIPPHISRNAPVGEKLVFDRLQDDPDTEGWVVLHSLDIKKHLTQLEGELDMVVLVPGTGVLCIEVKSCEVERIGGRWVYPYGTSVVGPFRQVSTAMHSLRVYLASRDSSLSGLMFFSAVVFTHVDFDEKSPEWHPWQYINRQGFLKKPFSRHITDIMENAHQLFSSKPSNRSWYDSVKSRPTKAQIGRIAEVLRGDFEYAVSPSADVVHLEESIKRFTEEQFEALDQMASNDRIIFQGAAGTGKTFLALEIVRRALSNGRKVLFLCYNSLLGDWITKETSEFSKAGDNVFHRGTFHGLLIDITGLEPSEEAGSRFWQEILPERAIDRLLSEETVRETYDLLVLDEAQDLLREDYLDVLDLLLKGGLAGGRWAAFGDFERQAIYLSEEQKSADDALNLLKRRAPNHSAFLLRTNCRNAEPIASTLSIASGLVPGYSRILRGSEGADVDPLFYRKAEEQSSLLAEAMERLLTAFKPREIVILSMRKDEAACVRNLNMKIPGLNVAPVRRLSGTRTIGYASIHAFKGLEAAAIILTDIEKMDDEHSRALLYVGMSRARIRLVMLMSENCRKSYDRILEVGLAKISRG
jgi:ATP:corrinoid adenosyltransferase